MWADKCVLLLNKHRIIKWYTWMLNTFALFSIYAQKEKERNSMSADSRTNHPQYGNLVSKHASSMTWNILSGGGNFKTRRETRTWHRHKKKKKNLVSGGRRQKKTLFRQHSACFCRNFERLDYKISWHAKKSCVKLVQKCTFVWVTKQTWITFKCWSLTFSAFQVFASRLQFPVWQEQKYYFNLLGLWAAWFMLHYFSRLSEFGPRWQTKNTRNEKSSFILLS